MSSARSQRGFMQLLVIVIVLLVALSVANVNLRELVQQVIANENVQYLWGLLRSLWINYLAPFLKPLWEKLITPYL